MRKETPCPLKRRDGERVGQKKVADTGDIGLARSRDRFADRTHGDPRGIVALGHYPLGEALETVLHLGAGVLLVGSVPGDGDQALRADHRPRIVIAVGHVFAEALGASTTHNDVVLRNALRHFGHLRLDLLMA